MLAIFCTYLVCAEIDRTQSRSPELRQVLMACAFKRVLTIIDHRAVQIFELGLALHPIRRTSWRSSLVMNGVQWRRVAQIVVQGFSKVEEESLNFAFHLVLPKLRLNSRNTSEKTIIKKGVDLSRNVSKC